jgi:endonuclease/exonuclease/phosphatase (EEP) superfamily protein YafD
MPYTARVTRRLTLHRPSIVCAALGTLLALLAPLGWPAELACHFPVQYALVAGIGTAAAALGKHWAWAGVGLAVALLNGWTALPAGASSPVTDARGPELRLVFANVLGSNRDAAPLLALARETRADLVLIVELRAGFAAALDTGLPDLPHRLEVPRGDNFGVGVWSRFPLAGVEVARFGGDLPTLVASVEHPAGAFPLVVTHPVPPVSADHLARRDQHLGSLGVLARALGEQAVLCGDLNATPWSPAFQALLASSGLQDGRAGHGLAPTWPSSLGPLGIPIDHCLVGRRWSVSDLEAGPAIGSDHRPLAVVLTRP